MMSNKCLKSPLMIGSMVLSWSIYYAVSKVVVSITGSPPVTGMLLRLAALIFLSIQLGVTGKLTKLIRKGRVALVLTCIGIFGFLLDLFANLGYASGSLSTGTALLKTDVLMVNLASVIVYRKKLFLSDWVGTFVMLAGVLMVLGVNFGVMTFQATDLYFILSAACVTTNAFVIKSAQEKYQEDSDTISYYNNGVVLLLFTVSSITAGHISTASIPMTISFWILVLVGGLAQTGIYFFYYRNLRQHEVWAVKLYLLFMPVVSCFVGVLFLGEVLTVSKMAGILIVLAGASVILLRNRINSSKISDAG